MAGTNGAGKGRQPTILDHVIGERLREARLDRGLTQDGLGKMLGLSFQQIQKYENGSNRIPAVRLYKLAKALGVDMDYFFQDLDEFEASRVTALGRRPLPAAPGTDDHVARLFTEIPPGPTRDAVARMIEALHRDSRATLRSVAG